jgi:hypothetical protein
MTEGARKTDQIFEHPLPCSLRVTMASVGVLMMGATQIKGLFL